LNERWGDGYQREIKSLLKASDGLRCKDLLILTWGYEDVLKMSDKELRCLPLWKWLLK